MKKSNLILIIIFGLLLTRTVFGQNQNGLHIQIEKAWVMLDWQWHMGSIYTYHQTTFHREPNEKSEGTYNLEYGTDYEPIILRIPTKKPWKLDISYTWNQWGLGISWWQFSGSDVKFGRITTPAKLEHEGGNTTTYKKGFFMWDHAVGLLTNQKQESGWTPVNWWGENSLRFKTADIYLLWKTSEKKGMRIGLKVVDIVNKQGLGQKQWAYIVNSWGLWIWDNEVTLRQTAQINYRVIGPSVGLTRHTKYLQGLIQGAILFTPQKKVKDWVLQAGHWDDIDDIDVTEIETDDLFYDMFYDGNFPFELKTRETIPALDINITLTHPPLRIYKTTCIRFNLNLFGSGLYAPIAPKWSMPGAWTWAQGTHWKTQKQWLNFYGLTLGLEITL